MRPTRLSGDGAPAIPHPAALLSGRTAPSALLPATWAVLGWLALALPAALLGLAASRPPVAQHALLTLAPAAAAAGCLWARGTAPPTLRPTWLLLALAGAAVALRELITVTELVLRAGPAPAMPNLVFFLVVGAHLSIGAGAVMAIPTLRSRALAGGLLLDSALVAVAAGLFMLQLAVQHGTGVPLLPLLRVLGSQLATAFSLFAIGLVLVWGDPALPRTPIVGLVTAALAFGLGNTLLVLGLVPPGMGARLDPVWITGWMALAFAGLTARALRDAPPDRAPGHLAAVVGGVLIPAGSLYVAALGLSSVLAPYLGAEIGLALWFLAAPLAVRVGQGLRAEVRRKAQGRELVQTRALVELNRALAAALELQPTLELVTRWARKLTDARTAAITLLSDDGNSLEVRAVSGLPPGAIGIVLPVEESFCGAVVRDRHPRVVHDWKRLGSAHPREIPLFAEESGAAAPLLFRERALGVLIVGGCDHPFDREQIAMLASMADSAAVAIENARLFEEVRGLALTDPLTGLANRRALEHELAREFAAAHRGRQLVIVMLDIDGFKRYNDTRGHLAGDDALRALGAVLLHETRAMNQAARYGGDEFVVLLAETDLHGAEVFAERMRWRFRNVLAATGGGLDLTYGIAEFDPSMSSPAELLSLADQALYRGKARGAPVSD